MQPRSQDELKGRTRHHHPRKHSRDEDDDDSGDTNIPPSKRTRRESSSPGRDGPSLSVQVGSPHDVAADTIRRAPPQQSAPMPPRPPEKDRSRRLSCKECRRLKLKCDRIFPCQSCVKRGCASLCPEGALTSGRGSRFILANTEQLHEKITQLSDRVRELENALGESHRENVKGSGEQAPPHPLLSPDKLKVKTSQDLYGIPIDKHKPPTEKQNIQQQQSEEQPVAGPSRLTSSTIMDVEMKEEDTPRPLPPASSSATLHHRFQSNPYSLGIVADDVARFSTSSDVHPDVLLLSKSFPFPWPMDLRMRGHIRDALPPRLEAQEICEQAQSNALWQYHLDSSTTFQQNLLHHCYTAPIEEVRPRRLALLLMLLAIGSVVDLRVSPSHHSGPVDVEHGHRPERHQHLHGGVDHHKEAHHRGEAYHHLARAAACEIPLVEEPDLDVLHALFFMIWWQLMFSDNKKSVGYAWNLMGLVTKLAQGLGLHRDSPRLKGFPEEYEKRGAIFWELLNLDCRMSLSLGRPPSMCLSHTDTKQPTFSVHVPRKEITYHEWKNRFFVHCLSPLLEAVVDVNPLPYTRFLVLDSKVRDFGMPALLLDPDDHSRTCSDENSKSSPRFLVMQHALAACSREIALLQLHRRYFTEAMNSAEAASKPFDLHHPHAPSLLATYLGAASLVSIVEKLFAREPILSSRFLCFWFNAYSAAVTLSLFALRAPQTPFALNASVELDRICRLFMNAANILPISGRLLPRVEWLAAKARESLKYQSLSTRSASDSTTTAVEAARGTETTTGYNWNADYVGESLRKAHPALLHQAESLCASTSAAIDDPMPSSSTIPPRPDRSLSPAARKTSVSNLPSGSHSQQPYSSSYDDDDDVLSKPSTKLKRRIDSDEPHMPDIYQYHQYRYRSAAETELDATFRYNVQPRVGGKEEFNLDHGSLAGEFGETSYMAWF